MFCDPNFNQHYTADEFAAMQEQYAAMNNAAIEDLPEDLVITTHDCRGNYHSTWASAGGYATVADVLFGKENVAAYYLEFDDDRSGDFEPLAKVSGDKKVVLGLITSKKPELEDPEVIKLALPKRPSMCRLTACACPPSAVSRPPRKATSLPKSSSGPRSRSCSPSPRTYGASDDRTRVARL